MEVLSDGIIDTLNNLTLINGSADLSFINGKILSVLKIFSEFAVNKNSPSPGINSLSVGIFLGLPELGTNYQVVSSSFDTIEAGMGNKLKFYVYIMWCVVLEADSFDGKRRGYKT